MQYKVGEQEGV